MNLGTVNGCGSRRTDKLEETMMMRTNAARQIVVVLALSALVNLTTVPAPPRASHLNALGSPTDTPMRAHTRAKHASGNTAY